MSWGRGGGLSKILLKQWKGLSRSWVGVSQYTVIFIVGFVRGVREKGRVGEEEGGRRGGETNNAFINFI